MHNYYSIEAIYYVHVDIIREIILIAVHSEVCGYKRGGGQLFDMGNLWYTLIATTAKPGYGLKRKITRGFTQVIFTPEKSGAGILLPQCQIH